MPLIPFVDDFDSVTGYKEIEVPKEPAALREQPDVVIRRLQFAER